MYHLKCLVLNQALQSQKTGVQVKLHVIVKVSKYVICVQVESTTLQTVTLRLARSLVRGR